MLLRAIDTQSLRSHFEFLGSKPKGQERENPNQSTNCIGGETLQGSYIHRLGTSKVIPTGQLANSYSPQSGNSLIA